MFLNILIKYTFCQHYFFGNNFKVNKKLWRKKVVNNFFVNSKHFWKFFFNNFDRKNLVFKRPLMGARMSSTRIVAVFFMHEISQESFYG